MKIKEKIEFKVKNPNSRISFEKTGGGSWEVWDRYISIDKQKLYHIGNVCDTCAFFFLKQEQSLDIDFNKDILIESLNTGKLEIKIETIEKLSKIVPNGSYLVLKTIIKPDIVTKESRNNYFTNEQRETWRDYDEEPLKPNADFKNYYREDLVDFGKMEYKHKDAFFNFFIPLYDVKSLNQTRVDFYKGQILGGKSPYAVSLGILDVKTSEEYPIKDGEEVIPEFGTHWCLANYIIDGHHKIKAASDLNKEIELITFISRDESWKLIDDMVSKIEGEEKKNW
jgi:hypothetical protein